MVLQLIKRNFSSISIRLLTTTPKQTVTSYQKLCLSSINKCFIVNDISQFTKLNSSTFNFISFKSGKVKKLFNQIQSFASVKSGREKSEKFRFFREQFLNSGSSSGSSSWVINKQISDSRALVGKHENIKLLNA